MPPLLILDVSNLAHRAFHALGNLTHKGQTTATLFGVFRDLLFLQERYQTPRIAFCFDDPIHSLRREVYPLYREARSLKKKLMTVHETKERKDFLRQLQEFPTHLQEMGFRNVFQAKGYEADDIIASLVYTTTGEVVVVSSDKDLYQLLHVPGLLIHNPIGHKVISDTIFRRDYHIGPEDWVKVKAIAGCESDGVKGIFGVGEKTAIRYLKHELSPTTKAYKNIFAGREIIETNMKLVRLPYEGCPDFELQEDEVTPRSWDRVVKKLGMNSLMGRDHSFRRLFA